MEGIVSKDDVPQPVASTAGAVIEHARLYTAPWHEKRPDGSLSEPYGPRSPTALARRVARHKDWSFRPQPKEARRHEDADLLAAFVAERERELPEGELRAYRAVYLANHTVRWCARTWGVRKQTVQKWLVRLRAKAGAWRMDETVRACAEAEPSLFDMSLGARAKEKP